VRATRGVLALFINYTLPVVVGVPQLLGVPMVESYRRVGDRVYVD
jgi:hypothetical protein